MWDFAGPYTIGTRKLAFGAPTRYVQLTLRSAQEARDFDAAVQEANEEYCELNNQWFDEGFQMPLSGTVMDGDTYVLSRWRCADK
jgi:hypothetical protein